MAFYKVRTLIEEFDWAEPKNLTAGDFEEWYEDHWQRMQCGEGVYMWVSCGTLRKIVCEECFGKA